MELIDCNISLPTRLTPGACVRHQRRTEKHLIRAGEPLPFNAPVSDACNLAACNRECPREAFCPPTCPHWGRNPATEVIH